jgi:hypothetical protein
MEGAGASGALTMNLHKHESKWEKSVSSNNNHDFNTQE